ncbi:dTDP-4-dehydrorhamnose 3,5-epimerase [Mesotoga sp. UBA5825]|uniref:dTDP-4-dehydrorhamnose 3,5-epimerase n=1 Tax=Mesotoga sp. UBA5825 TaxID=1946858 RepID=UPI0025F65ABD|nr:dTDP-4-dehydrorhamnose 3,5-epimerase [Mesotoga sp. UBA5825]
MSKFTRVDTVIPDLFIIEPTVFGDNRGFFMETHNKKEFVRIGIDVDFIQDNHSKSKKGTLRGLHFQNRFPQAKLVRVIRGEVYDVAVDIRENSPSFGKWFGVILSEENKKQSFIPKGFAHGFLALTDIVEFTYKCSDYYHPEDEAGIIWSDPEISIEWPLEEYGISEPLLSEKDKKWPTLKELKFSRLED